MLTSEIEEKILEIEELTQKRLDIQLEYREKAKDVVFY
jgi:hypothetical protein